MKNVTISIELANQILSYLITRPFQETYLLINELQKQATPKEEVKKDK